MALKKEDVLILKAAIELGSNCNYTIKKGGLGKTLVIDAGTRSKAREVRKKVPIEWEGLYTLVIYNKAAEEDEEDSLYDPSLM
jgi:hypothetical protein